MINRLLQTATLWRSTPSSDGGYAFSAPEIIPCKWHEGAQLMPGSTTVAAKAVVYLDTDVTPEDYILLGEHSSLDPTLLGAPRVAIFQKVPDMRNLDVMRKAWLV